MRRTRLAVLLVAACAVRAGEPGGPGEAPDALAHALDAMNIGVRDLGYRPKAHWPRYPHVKTVPYVLPFFEDLLANPLDTYEFTRTLGNVVEDLLTPEKLAEAPDDKDRKETLFKLGVALGTDRRIGGFRGYSANLDPRPWKEEPLLHALVTLLERSGTPLRDPPGTFGGAFAGKGEEDALGKLRAQVAAVPEPLHPALARFILNLIDAREWIDRGLRRVPQEMRDQVYAALPTLAEDTPDGTRYYAVIDDVARLIDEHSLFYGCLKALQATHDARRELEPLIPEEEWDKDWELRLATGWGTVVIDHNPVNVQWVEEPFLIVRCSPGNNLDGPVGATGPRRPLSVALLLGDYGDRHGTSFGSNVQEDRDRADVATGILGCGIVYAAGSTTNYWKTGEWGLGCGLFGLGALVDEGGDDHYLLAAVGQGSGWFGAGLLLDAAGDDRYELLEGDGQGHGGPGGIGVLADRSGNDTYYCEPSAAKAGRADYHSADEVAASNAQGAGFGRRGDGSDGHVWAGGLGALIDVDGNDTYEAGNFSQGIGYWYGTGLLWDGGGNDTYKSVYFTQGSGAHFAVGALIDEGGDDTHLLGHNAGAAFGFGWDVVNAFLIDRGAGSDRYEAKVISLGLAEVRSNAFFLDEGGNDTYVLDAGTKGLGDVDERKEYAEPRRTAPFPFHLAQVGLFLDLGGRDAYLRRDKEGALLSDPEAKDGATWRVRARDPAARHAPNVSCGADLEGAVLAFLAPWPAREPGAAR